MERAKWSRSSEWTFRNLASCAERARLALEEVAETAGAAASGAGHRSSRGALRGAATEEGVTAMHDATSATESIHPLQTRALIYLWADPLAIDVCGIDPQQQQ